VLSGRTPRRWLFLAVVALASAAVMPWAYATTDAGIVSVSGMPYGAAEILVLSGVAAILILAGRARAAGYVAVTAVAFSVLRLYYFPGSLEYGDVWDAELTAGPVLAVLGTVMLVLAATGRR